ncbi:MAG: lipoprotein insertase outer membrane protein LolB [Pseudomonadota bacterium]
MPLARAKFLLKFGLASALGVLISACATAPPPKPSSSVVQPKVSARDQLFLDRQKRLKQIDVWSFRGRAAVQRSAEGWSATLHWQQNGSAYRLRIVAPLGQGTYEILRDAEQVSLIDKDNQVYHAQSPEALVENAIGWKLPISNIEYWIRGLTGPTEKPSQLSLDEGGLIQDLASGGWRVSILEYQYIQGVAMPRKLFMNYGDTKIRVVISKWDLDFNASQ